MGVASFVFSSRGDIGQHACTQDLKYTSVPKEPRNRDVAAFVKDAPLRQIGFEPRSVSRKTVQSEIAHPLPQALAHLTSHFAETGPAQLELR
jgi:hypothetical protein